jgi:hypothetical protein
LWAPWDRVRCHQRCPLFCPRRQALRRVRPPGASGALASGAPEPLGPGMPGSRERRPRRVCSGNSSSVNGNENEPHRSRRLTNCGACARRPRDPVRLSERPSMRPFLIVAATLPLLCCGLAFAQVGTAMPPLGVTSSLGTDPSAPVGTNGLAPGLSTPVNPVPNGVTGTIAVPSTSSGAGACSTLATSPMGTFGSPATYDGGGMAMAAGTTTPATAGMTGGVAPSGTSSGISTSTAISATSGVSTSSGMLETSGLSGMCGSGSSSLAASSSPTSMSPTASSGPARTGVPLGSYEIGNLGVSPTAAVPTTSVSPTTGSAASSAPSVPTMPAISSPSTASSTATSTIP